MDRLPPQAWMTDPKASAVLDALEALGGADCARFVGGCVRNALSGHKVADVDIATWLTPPQTIAALEAAGLRAAPTGVEHGTVTAISGRAPFEVTTLRRDVETDGRRAVVAFTTDWAEDAARRDFRLNALYADRAGRLYDYVGGGVEDALAGRIVFVGDAETRLCEDYLRILRFFRFYAWYGQGEPDATALDACTRLKDGLARLSAERVSSELLKLMAAPDPRPAMALMDQAGVLALVLPFALERARFQAMVEVDADAELRLSALLPDDDAAVVEAAARLRLSNAQRERLLAALLPETPAVAVDLDRRAVRAAVYQLGPQAFRDRLKRAWAEAMAAGAPGAAAAPDLLAYADHWRAPRFPLGGADVLAAGAPLGPEVGRLLREVEAWWVAQDFPEHGAREELQALATGAGSGPEA